MCVEEALVSLELYALIDLNNYGLVRQNYVNMHYCVRGRNPRTFQSEIKEN